MKTKAATIRPDEHEALSYVKEFLTNRPQPGSLGLTMVFDTHVSILLQGWFPPMMSLPAIKFGHKPCTKMIAISARPERPHSRERNHTLTHGNVSQRIRNVLRAAYALVVLRQNPDDFIMSMPVIGQSQWCWTATEDIWDGVRTRGAVPIAKIDDLSTLERIAICCAALNRGTSFEEAICAPPSV